jgi:uncharacterized protein YggE
MWLSVRALRWDAYDKEMRVSESTVKVRGFAIVPAEPDEAEISVSVNRLDAEPHTALDDVVRRSNDLEGLLDEMEIPRSARSTSGVSVREESEYDDGRYHHRGYRAVNVLRIRLSDPEKMGRLIQEASSRSGAQVEGPWWRIALNNPSRAKACKEAATDAKRKAQAYAESLGVRLGVVLSVTEPGLDSEVHGARYQALAAQMEPSSAGVNSLSIEAGHLDVSSAVDVVFRLEQD